MRIPTAIRIPLYLNDTIFIWPFLLMIFIGLVLPSTAKHGLLNLKSLAFVMAIGSVSFLACKRATLRMSTLSIFWFFSVFITFLLAWFFIGGADPLSFLEAQFDQLKLFIITISVPLMAVYLFKEELLTPQKFLKTIIYANFFYCVLKITIFILQIVGGVDIWKYLTGAGIRIQSMTIFGAISRLQSSVDVATPFLFFYVLKSNSFGLNLSRKFIYLYALISIISNLLAFSRFLIFIQFLGFLLYLFTANRKQFLKGVLALGILTTLGVGVIGVRNVTTAIEARFFSRNAKVSDQERNTQINAMLDEHDHAPYIGIGLGGYAKDSIRDKVLKHSYEVQWISFLMQFGIIGVLFLLFSLGLIAYQYFHPPFSRISIASFILFGCWVLSGFTNPFLISLQSGILYTLFYLAPYLEVKEVV